MNWANRLTIARFFLTIGFVAVLTLAVPFSGTIALALFIVASITDYLDGWMARKFSMKTPFGALMDPLVDKIMTAAAFICLIPIAHVPAWVVIVIISREFVITGLRLLALSQGKVLSAESIGKHKTGWQMATVIFFLMGIALVEIFPSLGGTPLFRKIWPIGEVLCLSMAVALTAYSGMAYLWRHRAMIQPG
ncbi:MAG TPA: CDP-diacylglycerol--glycerol-3-phosphate 3-phosphatidyltransferase [Chthoniobacterales bacterium]